MDTQKVGRSRLARTGKERAIAALAAFVSTIQATGGLIAYDDGTFAPLGEPDWIDLGDAAISAREALIFNGRDVLDFQIENRRG